MHVLGLGPVTQGRSDDKSVKSNTSGGSDSVVSSQTGRCNSLILTGGLNHQYQLKFSVSCASIIEPPPAHHAH